LEAQRQRRFVGEKLAPGLLDHYLGKTAYQSQQVEEKRSPSQNRLLRTSLQNLAASWFQLRSFSTGTVPTAGKSRVNWELGVILKPH